VTKVADEEVTDLTEDGEAASKGKKKQKKVKEPTAENAPKEKKKPKEKGKKKGGGGGGGVVVIMILVLLILVGGFGAAMYFDVLGTRSVVAEFVNDPLIRVVIWLDPAFSTVDRQMRVDAEVRERRIEELENDAKERNEESLLREDILNTREQQLDRREQELNNREQQIIAMYERTIPIYRRDMTEEELEDMMSLARTYTQMSPEDAASIMARLYDPRDVAGILYFMAERNKGSILAAFAPEYAAQVTEILLYY